VYSVEASLLYNPLPAPGFPTRKTRQPSQRPDMQCSAVQCSAVQSSSLTWHQQTKIRHSQLQDLELCRDRAWAGPLSVQCSAVQCSAVQCSAVPSNYIVSRRRYKWKKQSEEPSPVLVSCSGNFFTLTAVHCTAVRFDCSAVQCCAP
jgi:hypothetical protein